MFETSGDILNIVKAISIFSISLFLSWAIFYFAMILRQVFKVVKDVKSFFDKVDEILNSIKEKIEHSSSHILLISEGIKRLVDIIAKYTDKKKDKELSK